MNRINRAYTIAALVMPAVLFAIVIIAGLMSMADSGAIGVRVRERVPEVLADLGLPADQLAERGEVNNAIEQLAVSAAMDQLEPAWQRTVFLAVICGAASALCTAGICKAKYQADANTTSPSPPSAPPPRDPAP
ncbi:MAG: hypothetical protein AAFS11_07510 [Planctomycetota bacterium]